MSSITTMRNSSIPDSRSFFFADVPNLAAEVSFKSLPYTNVPERSWAVLQIHSHYMTGRCQ